MAKYYITFKKRKYEFDSHEEARIKACKLVGKSINTVHIDTLVGPEYGKRLVTVDSIWYDSDPGYAGYSDMNKGYIIRALVKGEWRTQRVSPKTGGLLDANKYYKYY